MFLVVTVLLPLVFVGVGLTLLFAKRRTGLILAFIFFAACLAAGYWAISQSRSSTAAIGIFFLPFYGSAAGVLGWAFGNCWRADQRLRRMLGWICLAGAVGIVGLLINGGIRSIRAL